MQEPHRKKLLAATGTQQEYAAADIEPTEMDLLQLLSEIIENGESSQIDSRDEGFRAQPKRFYEESEDISHVPLSELLERTSRFASASPLRIKPKRPSLDDDSASEPELVVETSLADVLELLNQSDEYVTVDGGASADEPDLSKGISFDFDDQDFEPSTGGAESGPSSEIERLLDEELGISDTKGGSDSYDEEDELRMLLDGIAD